MSEGSKFWWVNQGRSYERAKRMGLIWASVQNEGGKSSWHWDNVAQVIKGDVLFNYVSGSIRAVSIALSNGHRATEREQDLVHPGGSSWVAETSYQELSVPISMERISNDIRKLVIDKGPIDKNGNAKMGYLFGITQEAAAILTKAMRPTDVPKELSEALQR